MKNNAASGKLQAELVITRVFDAPPDVVFKAWTDPRQMAQWWGPKNFTNPVCELDVRPGGAWRIVMRAPDGTEYISAGVYSEVVKPERLVFTNNAYDHEGKSLLEGVTSVTFQAQGAKTKLTLETRVVGKVSYAAQMLAGMEAGWNQSLDRLADLVAKG
ncbi:MAG TPA: SRPBCC domain-containing protein [Candidatus Angelobacter sp.]|nr:SRPBCC domain-containing protein [Candidatus Angelobacter sp.]